MKEDYLWDKTGENAEIERLENALKAFRYAETAPPALPRQVFEIEPEKPRRFFRLGFAFAAFAAVAVISFAVWFQLANNKIPVAQSVAATNAPPKSADQLADESVYQTPEIPAVKVVEKTRRFSQSQSVRIRRNAAPIIRPDKTVRRDIKVKELNETLTAEEKYAYDQLMLALSITGSKLKIVKDKVDGIEEKTAALDTVK